MQNVSILDRIVRLLLGIAVIVASAFLGWQSVWIVPALIVGIALLITGAVGFCPIYAALGLSSKRQRSGKA